MNDLAIFLLIAAVLLLIVVLFCIWGNRKVRGTEYDCSEEIKKARENGLL